MSLKTILAAALAFASFCAAPAFAQTDSDAAPALYVVRDEDSTLYLFGTIHLRRTGASWGGPHVEVALAEAEEIWTEVDLSATSEAQLQALVMQHGFAPADQPLSSWLEPDDAERLSALSARLGLPMEALDRMQPWMASMTLVVMPMVQAGFDPMAGVDRGVAAWGEANGRTMRAFETAEQQIGFFVGLDAETQREMLLSSIEDAERGVAIVNALSDAWDRGDESLIEMYTLETARDYPEIYDALFVRRNNAWMITLNEELDGAGVDFVAVGAGHLAGADGLVAQLRARGLSVERVQAP